MSTDTVKIEVDGKVFEARKGQMLIQVTDAHGIYVPRFCYHDKLSVAANCRMCLVQVEKAPKPLPACATPVMDGMKVHTRSPLAVDAQKSVMEFLLINHPLDCPICDQGGECELQDLAMGYGRDVSRYQENKRVVRDKDIGPLVQTEMTRCIHCTRCVRFGKEIAGMPELGATGRGEFMEIGTYVEKAMSSELSGNVIDLCPVGALTSKPFRFSARAWEMQQFPGIAPHDGVGSNIHFHVNGERVKRVVPAANEAVNEVWLSDRDRYSYEGMYSPDRLHAPMVKQDGAWKEVDWSIALAAAAERLNGVKRESGPQGIGGLISPSATGEELFLFQKLLRGLGSPNIDHRLRQADFSDQDAAPVYPSLGVSIEALEKQDAVLVIGGHPRKEQPLLNHRLRKAALRGARIMYINAVGQEFNHDVAAVLVNGLNGLTQDTLAVLKALLAARGGLGSLAKLLGSIEPGAQQRKIAELLAAAGKTAVLLGNSAQSAPHASAIRFLAGMIAKTLNGAFGTLGDGANSAGAWLCGALPHRGPGGNPVAKSGKHTLAMLQAKLPAYLLFNMEPEADCSEPALAVGALQSAQCVVALSGFRTPILDQHAHVLLPIAVHGENEGSYINVEGRLQSARAAVPPLGEAKPGWKVLRVLADHLKIAGLGYDNVDAITREIAALASGATAGNLDRWRIPEALPKTNGSLQRVTVVPMNATDPLVRRAPALQEGVDVADGRAHINAATASKLGFAAGARVHVRQRNGTVQLPVVLDEGVPEGIVLLHGGNPALASLGGWFGEISLQKG